MMNILGIIGGLVLAAFYIGAAIYIGKRIYKWLVVIFPLLNGLVFAGVFVLLAALSLKSLVPMTFPLHFSYVLRMIGGYLTGFLMYLLIFLVFVDLLVLIAKKCIPTDMLHKICFYGRAAALFLTLVVAGYGAYNATQIKIVTYDIQLQRQLDGEMTILLISDLHLGEVHSERRLEGMVSYINSLNPDIVCIAGDIFNDDFYAMRHPERAAALLRGIDATYGVFASLGNHDKGPTLPSMLNFLEESEIRLLMEEYVIIDNRLVLIGRLDGVLPWIGDGGFGGMQRGDFADIMYAVRAHTQSRDLPVVVIDHNPTHINEYGSDVDLALFGHTHGGGLFPINFVTGALYVIDHGHFQLDSYSPHIIVTQGVHGWSIPLRVGTNNEIAKILIR